MERYIVFSRNAAFNFLSVFFPQVKQIITPKRTTGVILGYLIYLVMTTLALNLLTWWRHLITTDRSNYNRSYHKQWNMYISKMLPDVQSKWMTITKIEDFGRMAMVKMPNPILYGIITIATILLIIAFKRSIRERKSLAGKTKASNPAKGQRLVQSVIAVCVIFIATSSPKNIMSLLDAVSPGWFYNIHYGLYITNLGDLLEAINHSCNIFVYLSMNSKFIGRFKGLFGLRRVRGLSAKNESIRKS